ncbi:MAG TPA: GntR family transcriptional regulator [Polyangiaceae bacterium]|nr:GntR family transcriptional regulator [Polyangiaceae bacterium]
MSYPTLQPEPGISEKTLPNRVAEHFIARIFTGEIPAGQRLPPDRELATLLGVDRTSLRMAMQQLSRMGLVKAVRGSGVCVLDYREHAGLDLLAAVFTLPNVSLGSSFLIEMLDDWIDFMPVASCRAFSRATSEDFREVDALFARQLALLDAGAEISELVEVEVAIQEYVVRALGNLGLRLLSNSSRALRFRIGAMFFETVDVRAHVSSQRNLVRRWMNDSKRASAESIERGIEEYRNYLLEHTAALRRRFQALPVNPSRNAAPTRPKAKIRTSQRK